MIFSKAHPRPPTVLDEFVHYLERSGQELLKADIVLVQYLAQLPKTAEHVIRIRQLGSQLTLEHDGPKAQGNITLKHVSMRLQSALVNYALDRLPQPSNRISGQEHPMPIPGSYL